MQLAWLFLLYEVAGIVTNFGAGWIAARFGLAVTLWAGMLLQIVALALLAQLNPAWSIAASVWFVMVVQGLSGVAKDMAKMASKSSVKLPAPDSDGALFRWVTVLTGSKNGRVNRLSLARLFLFGARDVWFVVGIPVYFQSILSDGSPDGRQFAFFLIGGFMALWIIGYGVVQAAAPRILGAKGQSTDHIIAKAVAWSGYLVPTPFALAACTLLAGAPAVWLTCLIVAGLLGFGFVFAVNSSAHYYLILAFAKKTRVSRDAGFYYMAHAAGRLTGTLLSGVSYQVGGLPLSLATAGVMAGLTWLAIRRPAV